jgi:hypothetical protein
MPDENRSDETPFTTRNSPPLQRAVLLFLLSEQDTWHTFHAMVAKGRFEKENHWELMGAIKSLHVEGLVLVSRKEEMAPSTAARHCHWLMTEVEPVDG